MRAMLVLVVMMGCSRAGADGERKNPGVDLPKWNGGDPASPKVREDLATNLMMLLLKRDHPGTVTASGKASTTFVLSYDWCTLTDLDELGKTTEIRNAGVTRLECDKRPAK